MSAQVGVRGYWNKEKKCMEYYSIEDIKRMCAHRRNNPVAPMIIQDTMDVMKHPGTGLFTDSKSAFERMNEASGLVNTGVEPNESWCDTMNKPTMSKKELQEIEQDIDQAYRRAHRDLVWGNADLSDEARESAKLVNEQYKAKTGLEPVVKGSL